MSTLDGILVTPSQANTGEFVEIVPALELTRAGKFETSDDHVWLKNLGTDVQLLWSQFWHDGGYALRLRRDVAEAIAGALAAEKARESHMNRTKEGQQ